MSNPMKLWYKQPAEVWVEALPIGNGRLGAMVFGGVRQERLQLNEDTLWAGLPRDWNNPQAKEALPLVRAAIEAEDWVQAHELCKRMQGPFTQPYLPLGDLHLDFASGGAYSDYERELDLDRALSTVRYRVGEATFTRECFSSFPDQVIVQRLSCDAPGQISFWAGLNSRLRHAVDVEEGDLVLRGQCPAHVAFGHEAEDPVRYAAKPEQAGLRFEVRVRLIAEGGVVVAEGGSLRLFRADSVLLLVAAATNFAGYDRAPGESEVDPSALALARLDAAASKTYDELLAAHVEDHRRLFGRVDLDLGTNEAVERPTDERLAAFHTEHQCRDELLARRDD
jgi:alpha-L-fucosidase 2